MSKENIVSVTCITNKRRLVNIDFPDTELIYGLNAIAEGEKNDEKVLLRVHDVYGKDRPVLIHTILTGPARDPALPTRIERN